MRWQTDKRCRIGVGLGRGLGVAWPRDLMVVLYRTFVVQSDAGAVERCGSPPPIPLHQ